MSVLGESLEDTFVEHDLVDEMPIADQLVAEYLEDVCLGRPFVYGIIRPQVFVASDGCLATML